MNVLSSTVVVCLSNRLDINTCLQTRTLPPTGRPWCVQTQPTMTPIVWPSTGCIMFPWHMNRPCSQPGIPTGRYPHNLTSCCTPKSCVIWISTRSWTTPSFGPSCERCSSPSSVSTSRKKRQHTKSAARRRVT